MKQLSVFVENRVGALTDATGILAANKVDIQAFCIADTSDFGIIRMIVDDCEQAADALRKAGFVVNIAEVVALETDNRPGAFHAVLRKLSQAGIFIEYSYAFLSSSQDKARFIIKVSDVEAAKNLLYDAS